MNKKQLSGHIGNIDNQLVEQAEKFQITDKSTTVKPSDALPL